MLNIFYNMLCALLNTKVFMGTYACRVFVMGLWASSSHTGMGVSNALSKFVSSALENAIIFCG